MTSRIEAAAKAIWGLWDELDENEQENAHDMATNVLHAAAAHDAANGIHRVAIDDATVERAVEVLISGPEWCECRRSPLDKHDVNPPCSARRRAIELARAVLAAAIRED